MADENSGLLRIPKAIESHKKDLPYLYEYVRVHGITEYVSMWETGPYKNQEAVYKAALEKGITWQELLNYDENRKRDYDI
ncbi:MAG: hypothetical protein K5663_03640 [Clostridiales bacterium]|nr:hypothetical protein [Clostridiales bacterium]